MLVTFDARGKFYRMCMCKSYNKKKSKKAGRQKKNSGSVADVKVDDEGTVERRW